MELCCINVLILILMVLDLVSGEGKFVTVQNAVDMWIVTIHGIGFPGSAKKIEKWNNKESIDDNFTYFLFY